MMRRLFPILALSALVLGVLACSFGSASPAPADTQPTASSAGNSPVSGSSSGACANPLYPVVNGATWNYSMSSDTPTDFTRSITDVRSDGFSDQDVFASGVTRTGEWKCDNGSLTALQPDSAVSATVQTNNMDAKFHTTDISGVTLPANVKPGDSWTQNVTIEGTVPLNGQDIAAKNVAAINCTAGAFESVTVKAGTFDAIRTDCKVDMTITMTMNGLEIPTSLTSTNTVWYANGVGMVKTVTEVVGGPGSTIELTGYNIP